MSRSARQPTLATTAPEGETLHPDAAALKRACEEADDLAAALADALRRRASAWRACVNQGLVRRDYANRLMLRSAATGPLAKAGIDADLTELPRTVRAGQQTFLAQAKQLIRI